MRIRAPGPLIGGHHARRALLNPPCTAGTIFFWQTAAKVRVMSRRHHSSDPPAPLASSVPGEAVDPLTGSGPAARIVADNEAAARPAPSLSCHLRPGRPS